jgi:ligand-binding sensor domain-containing protein
MVRFLHCMVLSLLCLSGFTGCADPIKPKPNGPVWLAFKGPEQPFRSNHINAILATRAGQVWFGTDSGATFYERGSWGVIVDTLSYVTTPFGSVIRQAKVTAITQGKDGSIWFGTGGGGLHRYFQTTQGSGIRWIAYNEPVISSNVITSLTCEIVVNGDIWAGTSLFGVDRFIPSTQDPRYGEWRNYTTVDVPGFGSNQISATAFDIVDNSIWVASIFNLEVFFNDITGWRSYPAAVQYDYRILSMTVDLSNNLWMGKREGAARLDRYREWTYYTNRTTGGIFPAGAVNAVTTDLFDTRWFGTTQGLMRLRDTTWTLFNHANAPVLLSDTITALGYDSFGNLWIGTGNGVNVYNEKGTIF